jgi:hypothetical protein
MIIRSEAARRKDVRPPRAESQKENLGQLGQSVCDQFDVPQSHLKLHVDTVLIADLERIGPSSDLNYLLSDQTFDALPNGPAREPKSSRDLNI